MSYQEIVFAGFGGQGILSMGKFLAYAGMDAGQNVSWLPSYGPEMRGGTANCSVIITGEAIGSPVVTNPTSLVVMNRPSLDRFEGALRPGGLLMIDTNLVTRPATRTDISVIGVPAQTLAEEIGSKKAANMILLGALVEKTGVVSVDALITAVRLHGKGQFFELNKMAIETGAKLAHQTTVAE
ncbi:2-oxoacid:acceptor oxidoreductase family protein [Alicyclobacillus curvatus]|jgi:2-oxoglutarate ferredoxin oxidoreductase subunit gamma|nr:2-oxoacid:acceptor oxidoreductase family protein [Alicyclobacillus curvatus]